MPSGDTIHGGLLWALLWITGIIPALIMAYIPVGLAWLAGYGVYLGLKRLMSSPLMTSQHQSAPERASSLPSGESDPSVMLDSTGAGTSTPSSRDRA